MARIPKMKLMHFVQAGSIEVAKRGRYWWKSGYGMVVLETLRVCQPWMPVSECRAMAKAHGCKAKLWDSMDDLVAAINKGLIPANSATSCTGAERQLIEVVLESYRKAFIQSDVARLDECVRAVEAERRGKPIAKG